MSMPPPIDDKISSFYWEGAARGELLVQRCASCESYQFPPSVLCERCTSREVVPVAVSGRGSIYAFTILRQAFLPDFAENLPYAIALVELDDAPGVRLMTNIVEADVDQLSVGDPLEVVFEPRGDGAVPQFRPAGVRS